MAEALLDQLVNALRCLPGVGPKSAQRMAFSLLRSDRHAGRELGRLLGEAMDRIGQCEQCRTLTELALCHVCADASRDAGQLCVVESPADLAAIEAGTIYRGRYFVLHGALSPLDGMGPQQIGADQYLARLNSGEVAEVILATGATIEGEATAHYLGELAAGRALQVTRLAQGVPLGGGLEFVDSGTLAHAFSMRQLVGGAQP